MGCGLGEQQRFWSDAGKSFADGGGAIAEQIAVFFRIRSGTERRGGNWLRWALIFFWDLTETAWLGGKV